MSIATNLTIGKVYMYMNAQRGNSSSIDKDVNGAEQTGELGMLTHACYSSVWEAERLHQTKDSRSKMAPMRTDEF